MFNANYIETGYSRKQRQANVADLPSYPPEVDDQSMPANGEQPFSKDLDLSVKIAVPERPAARAQFCGGIAFSGYEGMYDESQERSER